MILSWIKHHILRLLHIRHSLYYGMLIFKAAQIVVRCWSSCHFVYNFMWIVKLDYDPNEQYRQEINEFLLKMLQDGEFDISVYEFLIMGKEEIITPILYLFAKIHKGRPVVSQINSPTSRIAHFVDHFLNPCATTNLSYIKDTTHFLNILEDIGPLPSGAWLCTLDVSSLYTCIITIQVSWQPEMPFMKLDPIQMSNPAMTICFNFGNLSLPKSVSNSMGTFLGKKMELQWEPSWPLGIQNYLCLNLKKTVCIHITPNLFSGRDILMIVSVFGWALIKA